MTNRLNTVGLRERIAICEDFTGDERLFILSCLNEVEMLRSMVRRAMEHGLNGNDYYHAIKASELGEEMREYLEANPCR